MTKLASLFLCRSGATALEYGMIVGLIMLLIIGPLGSIGSQLNGVFDNIGTFGAAPTP